MPFIITGIIALVLFIGGVSVVKNSQTLPNVSSTPTVIQITTSPTIMGTSSIIEISMPTSSPTQIPATHSTSSPTTRPTLIPRSTTTSVPIQTNKSIFQCNCSKTCPQMVSCEEAYYQLVNCGCSKRDGDKDGVPCEEICPGG